MSVKTVIPYMYRDSANYKQFSELVLDGAITPAQKARLAATLEQDGTFIAAQVGLDHLGSQSLWSSWPSEDDHCWHELNVDSIDVHPNGYEGYGKGFTDVESFVAKMEAEKAAGWDEEAHAIEPSDDGNEFECSECGDYVDDVTEGLCQTCADEYLCPRCGERNDDGDGYDGYCGNCADQAEEAGEWDHHDAHDWQQPTAVGSDGPQGRVAAGNPAGGQFTSHHRTAPNGA